jgi:hypothetical protein
VPGDGVDGVGGEDIGTLLGVRHQAPSMDGPDGDLLVGLRHAGFDAPLSADRQELTPAVPVPPFAGDQPGGQLTTDSTVVVFEDGSIPAGPVEVTVTVTKGPSPADGAYEQADLAEPSHALQPHEVRLGRLSEPKAGHATGDDTEDDTGDDKNPAAGEKPEKDSSCGCDCDCDCSDDSPEHDPASDGDQPMPGAPRPDGTGPEASSGNHPAGEQRPLPASPEHLIKPVVKPVSQTAPQTVAQTVPLAPGPDRPGPAVPDDQQSPSPTTPEPQPVPETTQLAPAPDDRNPGQDHNSGNQTPPSATSPSPPPPGDQGKGGKPDQGGDQAGAMPTLTATAGGQLTFDEGKCRRLIGVMDGMELGLTQDAVRTDNMILNESWTVMPANEAWRPANDVAGWTSNFATSVVDRNENLRMALSTFTTAMRAATEVFTDTADKAVDLTTVSFTTFVTQYPDLNTGGGQVDGPPSGL